MAYRDEGNRGRGWERDREFDNRYGGSDWDRERAGTGGISSSGWSPYFGGYGHDAARFGASGIPPYGGEQTRWSGGGFGSEREIRRDRFYGRGPKGWKRSDERIQDEVSEMLARNPDVDASDVEVLVENGEVTLRGVVEDRGQKRHAEDIVEDIFGVEDVHNELKIRHGFLAGLTGEKADEREVTREAEREPSVSRTSGTTRGSTAGNRNRTGRSQVSAR
jgi:hypothetical protein